MSQWTTWLGVRCSSMLQQGQIPRLQHKCRQGRCCRAAFSPAIPDDWAYSGGKCGSIRRVSFVKLILIDKRYTYLCMGYTIASQLGGMINKACSRELEPQRDCAD